MPWDRMHDRSASRNRWALVAQLSYPRGRTFFAGVKDGQLPIFKHQSWVSTIASVFLSGFYTMGFSSGSVSFRRFAVTGKAAKTVDQKMIDKLAEHVLSPGEFGLPEEEEWGWCGGRHVLDGKFSFEHNVFNDCLHFALRIDTNRFH